MQYCDYQDELYHWGIKGQKWGVRRFQNKDGSLTPAGKKRYQKDQTIKVTGMSVDRAYSIANTKHNTINSAKSLLDYGITLGVPYAAVVSAGRTRYARQYIKNHPNTKLTYNQILQLYANEHKRKL